MEMNKEEAKKLLITVCSALWNTYGREQAENLMAQLIDLVYDGMKETKGGVQ